MSKTPFSVRRGEVEPLSVLGAELRFLCEAEKTAGGFSVMEGVLPLGMGPPPHHHPWDEAYYVLEGEVAFVVGDQSAVYRAGDFVYAPGGTVHAFQGASETPARILVMDAPAHAEAFFRALDRERDAPLPRVAAIAHEHDMTFLVPAEPA